MDKIPLSTSRKTGDLLHSVSFLESFHTASGIDQLLLAGKERVALRTDFRGNFRLGGPGLERIATETFHRYFVVLWMDPFSHIFLLIGATPRLIYRHRKYSN
jgi:hypothetical protein